MSVGNHTHFIESVYQRVLKPVLFRQDPEGVHDRFAFAGRMLAATGLGRAFTRALFRFEHPALVSTVAGIRFENPVGLAAGFDKNAQLWNILPDVGFGFAELGSVTGRPCAGNAKPRLWRMPKYQALQVYYGLKNDGAQAVSSRLHGKKARMVLGISAAKTNSPETADAAVAVSDYCTVVDAFRDIADYFTINISCPNAFGGQPFTDAQSLDKLLSAVDALAVRQPVFVKLSPDLTHAQLNELLSVMDAHRIAGIVCTNLTKDEAKMNIPKSDIPGRGGISGKAVQALSDAQLAYIAERTKGKYVLLGVGGIFSAEDAYRKLRLGASLVQLITGMVFRGPQLIGRINHDLVGLLERDGFKSVAEAVGADIPGWNGSPMSRSSIV
jgi:dihydroorotate dehydrogenase